MAYKMSDGLKEHLRKIHDKVTEIGAEIEKQQAAVMTELNALPTDEQKTRLATPETREKLFSLMGRISTRECLIAKMQDTMLQDAERLGERWHVTKVTRSMHDLRKNLQQQAMTMMELVRLSWSV